MSINKFNKLVDYCNKCCINFNHDNNKDNALKLVDLSIKYKEESYSTNNDLITFCLLLLSSYCLDCYFKAFYFNSNMRSYFSIRCGTNNIKIKNTYQGLVSSNLKLFLSARKIGMTIFDNYNSLKPFINVNLNKLNANYASLLNIIGRTIDSINIYKNYITGFQNNAVIQGNKGLTLALYSNITNNDYIRFYALKDIEISLLLYKDKTKFSNSDRKQITRLLRMMNELNNLPYKNIPNVSDQLPFKKDKIYRRWVSDKGLLLNLLNDIDHSIKLNKDTIQISSKACKYRPDIFNLFNLIKQKYVTARYFFYCGDNHNGTNVSDRESDVYKSSEFLENYHIDQIKVALDQFYSIFDKIACLLNNYFHLGVGKRRISFNSLFNYRNMKKLFKLRPNDIKSSDTNLALNGLYWMSQDFYSKEKDGLDYRLHIANKVRNAMTHRGFYILKDSIKGFNYISDNKDNTYTISWNKFYKVTLHLARMAREAIILVYIIINSTISEIKYQK